MSNTTQNLDILVPKMPYHPDVHTWATVTQASPLRVKLDGDDDPIPWTPQSIVSGLVLSDRVLVLLLANNNPASRSHRVIVLGKAV